MDKRFGKSGGLGDLEVLADPAPIEIGNRVWLDADSDGSQDPNETPISGVIVELYKNGVKVGQATTDGNGEYYFTSGTSATDANPNDNIIHDSGLGIIPGTGTVGGNSLYEIRIPNVSGASKQTALGTNSLTTANAGSNDSIDSDGTVSGVNASYLIPYADLAGAGYNNHTYDFGFGPVPTTGTIQIVKNTTGGNGSFGFTSSHATLDSIHLTTVSGSASSSVMTFNAGSYTLSEDALVGWSLAALSCTGDTDNGSVVTLANRQVTIDLDAGENIVCTFSNTAQPNSVTPSGVLTITKTVVGSSLTGPFNVTVVGPNGYVTNTTVTAGVNTLLTGLAQGVYTVTETSPGAGWTITYTATASSGAATGGSSHAVVALQNANTATLAVTPISGRVYRDFNSDGEITANGTVTDTGVANVTVTAYGAAGTSCGRVLSDSTGSYSFTPTCTGPWRVEFTNLPSGYEPTTHGTANGTSTQFVSSAPATNVNLGILEPCDYCQNSPNLATSEFRNGDPLAVGNNLSTLPALVSWPYSYGSSSPAPTTRATLSQTGAVWGLAYQRETKKLFSAAVVRRHAGLGPNGLGAIYQTDLNSGATSLLVNVSTSLAVNVGTIGSNSARGLPSDRTQPNQDATAFSSLGKVGMGDLDLSDDGKTLFFTNLFERNVYGLNIGNPATTPTTATRYDLPTTNCTNGVARPWALKSYRDTLYVGVVCTAEAAGGVASNLAAYVYAMDLTGATPAFASTPVLTTALNYPKGCVEAGIVPIVPNCQWNPWTDTFASLGHDVNNQYTHPQPIFSDLEFDVDGSLILAFTDRTSMQLGDANYPPTATSPLIRGEIGGDLLRAYPSGTNQWTLESGGDKDGPGPFTPTASNLTVRNRPTGPGGQGPGNGEFYYDETFSSHEETGMGALAFLPGSQHIATTAMNPVTFFQNGIRKFSNNSGATVGNYPILTGLGPTLFGKAAGLGDLELLCDAAPIEIGNRVWDDLDGDGIQDPGEPGLANITVSRQGPTNTVTTNTDANGLYYFGNLTPYTAYTLTLAPPAGYSLTAANQAALSGASVQSNHAISDTVDSDAALMAGQATIYYSTGGPGQNNHGLDFGFTQPVKGQVQIVNTAPSTVDLALVKTASVSTATPGLTFNYTLTVTNQSATTTATNVTLSDPLPAGLVYNNATASGGTGGSCSYNSGTRTVTCTWASLPPGEQAVATITVRP